MTHSELIYSRLSKPFGALTHYFMPPLAGEDRHVANQMRMFLGSHFLGPVLGLSVPLAFFLLDPTPGLDLLVLAAGILSFWAFPFLLKSGVRFSRLVLLSIAVDWFIIFWSCYFYGGAASPTVVWFLIIPILAVFYIGGDGEQTKGLLILSCAACAIFALAYFGLRPEPNDIPQPAMEVLGLLSAIAVMCYLAGMAVYYARVFDAGVELEREVTRRRLLAVELRKAVDEATQAASAKSEFLARMSHELRSPLNAILGYGELLQEEEEDDPNSMIGQDIDRIIDAGKYLTRLIDMILDLAKIEAGKMVFNMQEHDVGKVVGGVVERYREAIEASGITLRFEVSPDLKLGVVDAGRLDQVAESIITNAATYTEQGEIEITVGPDRTASRPTLQLVVRDTGRGIAADALPFIFESFVTERDAAEGRYGGTGLALSVTSKLCQAMNGTITAKSVEGKGSTFTVKLPMHRVPAAKDGKVQAPAVPLTPARTLPPELRDSAA